ncbi:MAG TPA: ABC transporter permease subunit [Allosphingosinicella sp.]|jgi:aminopeptidase N/ABC-type transport system involved in multi-copper enzyme maturation permease subunit
MFLKIARFELRYQIKNPVFWVAAAMFFLLCFGFMASQAVSGGATGNLHRNSPVQLAQVQITFGLFFMFVTTAFVSNIVVRDDETGFGPIIRSTPITRLQYLGGRFAGAIAASALAYLFIALGLWAGSSMPWVDPETLGPNRLSYYLYGFLVFGFPNLLVTAAIFFTAATLTRSMMWTYVAVVVFFLAWLILNGIGQAKPEFRATLALIEPFGAAAFGNAVKYWTTAERNTGLPPVEGAILLNRLIWLAVGSAFLAFAILRYRFAEPALSKKRLKLEAAEAARPPAASPAPAAELPAAGGSAAWAQLKARTGLEIRQVVRSPAFFVLVALGMINTIANLWFSGEMFGTPTLPVTRWVIPMLSGSFGIFSIIIAIYYSGELVWRERDRRMNEIIDATPLPNWAYIVPKTLAVSLVLFSTLLFGMVAAILVQVAKGYTDLELGKYVLWYLLPLGVEIVTLAALAVLVQSVSPNKYVGWAAMVVYIVATITMVSMGFEHNLYQYNGSPNVPLSDMNGSGGFAAGAWWFRLYWAAFAVLLLVASHLLWRRGTETRLRPRLRRAPRRLAGGPGIVAGLALATFVATGAWAYYNTNVLNTYEKSRDRDEYSAGYEKKYLKYEALPSPTISKVALNVALYPSDTRAVVDGSYVLSNLTSGPISDVHVRMPPGGDVELLRLDFPGARLRMDDAEYGYRIYTLDTPMKPGETRPLSFRTQRWSRGFRNSRPETKLVRNGTFLNNMEIVPAIGMDRGGMLQDRSKRRKYGLPPIQRAARLEDLSATRKSYFGGGWTTADIIVSTEADQVPIAPGKKVFDKVAGGRRTARFVSDAPILTFFSIQSARYAEKHRDHRGVDLAVYYHPGHAWNVDRMLNALATSMDYYQASFGPYQFDQARIIEFPGYQTFAQAFANTMPYSEAIGFVADTSDPEKIDYVTYITAHEFGHQYWGHQLIGAEMQGGTMLSETLAQYSALMVMKRLYGDDKIRRFLKYELDTYLRLRGGELVEELPLMRVENQQYIHYNKGSLVMYLLQDRLGEAAVNRALRGLLEKYRFKGAPYPRSIELVEAFRREAKSPEDQALITDLFERITLYDLKVGEAKATRRADGRWDVVVPVEAKKAYADGKGAETPAPLADRIAVGLFTAEPGRGSFDRSNVLTMQRQPVKSGKQVFRFVTDKKPSHAGIDPYNFYIDRNSDDNVGAVT